MASTNGSASGTTSGVGSERMRGGSGAPPAHPKSVAPAADPRAAPNPPAPDPPPAWPGSSGGSGEKSIPNRRGGHVPNPGPIGEYEVLEQIGRGGMGVVYKVKNPFFDSEQALKIIDERLDSKAARERFIEEMKAHARLRHTNIIEVHYAGVHRVKGRHNQLYFVMSLEPGDLTQRVKSGGSREPAKEAEIVRRLCKALAHAHLQGVFHRDLKPQNVLLGEDGTPKVTDFGLMKLVSGTPEARAGGGVIGTPAYMPPEQARGSSDQADARSDVYGLGAILYELLTGRPPYTGDTRDEILLHVKSSEITPRAPRKINPAVPARLEAICLRCLDKDPDRRFQTASELERALDDFIRPPWVVRHWRAVAVAGLVAALCGTLAAVEYKQFAEPRKQARDSKARGDKAVTLAEQIGHYEEAEKEYRKLLAPGFVFDRDRLKAEHDGVVDELRKRRVDRSHEEVSAWRKPVEQKRLGTREAAIQGYKEFAQQLRQRLTGPELPADLRADLTLELARAMTTLAELYTDDRNLQEADDTLDAAHQLLAGRTDREGLLALAEVSHVRGIGHAGRHQWDDALKHYQAGLRLRLEGCPPGDGREPDRLYRRNLARSHGYLGDAQRMAGQVEGARASYLAAADIRCGLATGPDATPADKCLHARDFDNLAELADWQGKVAEAVKHRADGLQYYLDCDLGYPVALPGPYRTERATRVLDYAELVLDDPGRPLPPDVERRLTEARHEFRSLRTGASADGPDLRSGAARAELAWARYQLAWVRHHNNYESDRLDAARAALADAARLLTGLDRQKKAEVADYYNWAAVLALQGQLARGRDERSSCFVLAVDRLEKVIELGFRKAARFGRDRAFAGFRSDEAYRKRLEDLAAAMSNPAPRAEAR